MLPMQEHYSYDSLVQLLYRDMPAGSAAAMAQLFEQDPDLQEMYAELQQAKTQVPKVLFNPSPTVINNILQYSTKTALEAQI